MNGRTWRYDGSLEGLIVLAHRAFTEAGSSESIVDVPAAEGELFPFPDSSPHRGLPLRVVSFRDRPLSGVPPLDALDSRLTGPCRAAEAPSSELRAFSSELFDTVIRIWMSEAALELPLLRLCAYAGLHGSDVLEDYGNPDLRAVAGASRRVSREIERLCGLARFSPRDDGLLAAALEPDANIVAALLPHFARRFGHEDFALVDVRRRLAFARRDGDFESAIGAEALAFLPDEMGDDDEEVSLWRRYFEGTENPSRKNPELQCRLMPRRYWRYLPEIAKRHEV
jgi:probable DNA metabolism protein